MSLKSELLAVELQHAATIVKLRNVNVSSGRKIGVGRGGGSKVELTRPGGALPLGEDRVTLARQEYCGQTGVVVPQMPAYRQEGALAIQLGHLRWLAQHDGRNFSGHFPRRDGRAVPQPQHLADRGGKASSASRRSPRI